MIKFTRNLSRAEFACGCGCGFDTVDYQLVMDLQDVVDHFQMIYPQMDVGIHINSGSRCKTHNRNVGGSIGSMHLQGKAGDFYLYNKKTGKPIDSDEVHHYLIHHFPSSHGIGRYTGRTHLDERASMARWDNT